MSYIDFDSGERLVHPVDFVEGVAQGNGWAFERNAADEITLKVEGRWATFAVTFTWMHDIEALHLACGFEQAMPDHRKAEVQELLQLINEQLWVGHFDLWPREGLIMYRHALMLSGGTEPSDKQCEALLATAVETCDRYFQSFQFVIWSGRPAREALDAALFETVGEA